MKTILMFMAVFLTGIALAQEELMTEQRFLQQAFDQHMPSTHNLWLKGQLKQDVKTLLGQDYAKIRIRYWQSGQKTAWILEQIGKDKPITAGFVVSSAGIEQSHVLAFRESRGWEIKRDAFTNQFELAQLTQDNQLSKHIDGITGATLSVNAMKSMARLALRLHLEVQAHFDQSN